MFSLRRLSSLLLCGTSLGLVLPGASLAAPGLGAAHRVATPWSFHPLKRALPNGGSSDGYLFYNFLGDPDGSDPQAGLVNKSGTLYGTTCAGGTNNLGAVFAITTSGSESVVHSFAGPDGECPLASLIDVGGTLYGTASGGSGSSSYGTVFSYSKSAGFKVVYAFQAPVDGAFPAADLTYANGVLYGTTEDGGTYGYGTVFKIPLTGSQAGQESVVYDFRGTNSGAMDGQRPLAGVVYRDGVLYGTTYEGGANSEGTIFSVSASGSGSQADIILHSFGASKKDGYYPQADLTFYKGALYGTTSNGGGANPYCAQGTAGCGTVFKITLGGKYKKIYTFDPGPQSGPFDGFRPYAGLINVNGVFYGTTYASQPGGSGTVYSVTPSGAESIVAVFGECPENNCGGTVWPTNPEAPVIDVDGVLYGTTVGGVGAPSDGTVFAIPI